MLNVIWILMVAVALACGALRGQMEAVSIASIKSAETAVALAIGLVGVMAFWIGAMRVLQEAGVMRWVARLLRPLMVWLFPGVPADHPAMSMMIMNMTSNMLGLGNAATPFGLKAMIELENLNEQPGTATNAMALFLAINTSNVAILPTGMIALRASLGSDAAGVILLPTLVATTCSTIAAIFVAKLTCRMPMFAVPMESSIPVADGSTGATMDAASIDTQSAEAAIAANPQWISGWRLATALGVLGLLSTALGVGVYQVLVAEGVLQGLLMIASQWALPLLILVIAAIGMLKGVAVYDCIVEGGKEGFQIALRIIPYLVAILVAVGMLRASGAIGLMVDVLQDATALIGMPAEALPMALLRSLSGSGAYAVSADIMTTHGPDSMVGMIVSTMQGSTETTFYVLALYYGVVQIKRVRHTLVACLIADTVGIMAAVWATRMLIPDSVISAAVP